MSDIWLIRSTFAGKDEAISVARTLLAERLVACANIGDAMTALYRWEGTLQQETEIAVLFKAAAKNVGAAIARIKELHSYQIPAIVAWKADVALPAFTEWVAAEAG